jgi:hypothetical protein
MNKLSDGILTSTSIILPIEATVYHDQLGILHIVVLMQSSSKIT